jgi:hypothetical protein
MSNTGKEHVKALHEHIEAVVDETETKVEWVVSNYTGAALPKAVRDLIRNALTTLHDQLLEQLAEECEGEVSGGKEWIEMVKSGQAVGLINMKHPESFIDGNNKALTDTATRLRAKKINK